MILMYYIMYGSLPDMFDATQDRGHSCMLPTTPQTQRLAPCIGHLIQIPTKFPRDQHLSIPRIVSKARRTQLQHVRG